MTILAERLTKARERAGIGKTELARRIGIQPPSVTYYEQGKRTPSLATLAKIAEALDVTSDWPIGIESDIVLTDEEVLAKYSPYFLSTLDTPEAKDRAVRSMKRLLRPTRERG